MPRLLEQATREIQIIVLNNQVRAAIHGAVAEIDWE